ncbi:MAG: UPF0147 family protein [Candidatus Thermoplasmatota archaeon]|nr:UPF0147 family protein [Candidatus Thermoplasmatota archaeon]
MDEKLYKEVLYLLEELSGDNSVPRNIRKMAAESKAKMENQNQRFDLRCATVMSTLDDLTNDPNVPSHGRAFLYTIMSKLEALSKS